MNLPHYVSVALGLTAIAANLPAAESRPAKEAPIPTEPATRASTGSDETIKLDPFVIREDDNVGYSANSTLAGTRINTALRDVGASISIITPEFLSDTATTNIGELLALTTSTEVGGIAGNFSGGEQNAGRPDQSESRENPQGNQRVRGIGPATNTRDYFITDIAFDSYNTSRVTINRGPNSLLFGIGNPAGIIEASMSRPGLSRNRNEATARYGSENSYRGTLDVNRVLVKDRLAFRIATVAEQNNYQQEPAFDRKRRIYGAAEGVLRDGSRSFVLGKTSLRVSGETGNSQATPVNVTPPINAFGIFFDPPDPSIDDIPGVSLSPTVKRGSPGFIWQPRVTVDNRASSTGIPQNVGGYYSVPYFIQIPLVYDTPGQSEAGYRNTTNPALTSLSGIMGRIRYAPNTNGRPSVDAISTTSPYTLLSGFVAPSLQNRDIFDYRKHLISGGSNRVEQTFEAGNIAVAQELFEQRGGIEVAFDRQRTGSRRALPFSFGQNGAGNGQSDIYIDVSQYLSNDQPNPNVGRPFMQQLGVQDRRQSRDRDAFRATAFYKFDFDDRKKTLFGLPLGNHTITGLFNQQQVDVTTENYQLGWESDSRNLNADVFQEAISGGFRRAPVVIQYLGPSVLTANSVNDVRITDVFNGQIPKHGDRHRVTFFDFTTRQMVTDELYVRRFLNGGSLARQKVESKSLSLKSDFFRDTIVAVIGWRWDHLRTYSNEANTRLADGTIDRSNFRLRDTTNLDEKGRNFTWSVVGRLPSRWQRKLPWGMEVGGYYNRSGNFNPIDVRSDLHGNIIPAPAGETKEYGALIELFQRRASLRLNWFETMQTNSSNGAQGATSGIYGFPNFLISRYRTAETQGIAFNTIPGVTAAGYGSYQQLYDALFQLLPEPTNTLKNLRFAANGNLQFDGIQGLTDTSNLNARGFEAELVGNLTKRWRVSANAAKQETVVDGSARLTKQVADAVFANLVKLNLLGIDQGPALPERQSAAERFASNVGTPLAATVARDGAVSQEQRRWRANITSTYDLRDLENPVLNKMSVGASVRWQSRIAIGNPFITGEALKQKIVATDQRFTSPSQIRDTDEVMQTQFPDLQRPYYGPEELAGDFWISYRRAKVFKNIDWRVQLNVRNAWGNGEDIPVTANPDGSIAVVRIPNETRWFLTNTFSF